MANDKVKVATSKLTALADAIRAKSGGSEEITLGDIPTIVPELTIPNITWPEPGGYTEDYTPVKTFDKMVEDGNIFVNVTGTGAYSKTVVSSNYNSGIRKVDSIPNKIKRISIRDDITSIGNRFLYNLDTILEVRLPDTLRTINDDAFYGATSLKDVNFPTGLTYLGAKAFSGTAIEYAEIPATVMDEDGRCNWGYDSFRDCANLTSAKVLLPYTGKGNYGTNAFMGCDRLAYIFTNNQNIGSAETNKWGAPYAIIVPQQ